MASSTPVSELRPELSDFLYASIDEGGNGRLLSVLSVLARLNVDPWQEAASLARMPRENAAQRLASLIAALPDGPSAHQDTDAVATRLITLLPHSDSSSSALPGIGALSNLSTIVYMIIINLIFVAVVFGSQYFLTGAQPPAGAEHAHVSVAGGATSKPPPLAK